jgi:predicted nucleic acid-binding protein
VITYFDASALVKLQLLEDGTDLAIEVWNTTEIAATSTISLAEVPAAFAAAARAGRLTQAECERAMAEWNEHTEDLHVVNLDRADSQEAGLLAAELGLAGMDSLHLQSAGTLGPRPQILMCTWDRQLHRAAIATGHPVSPATLKKHEPRSNK